MPRASWASSSGSGAPSIDGDRAEAETKAAPGKEAAGRGEEEARLSYEL